MPRGRAKRCPGRGTRASRPATPRNTRAGGGAGATRDGPPRRAPATWRRRPPPRGRSPAPGGSSPASPRARARRGAGAPPRRAAPRNRRAPARARGGGRPPPPRAARPRKRATSTNARADGVGRGGKRPRVISQRLVKSPAAAFECAFRNRAAVVCRRRARHRALLPQGVRLAPPHSSPRPAGGRCWRRRFGDSRALARLPPHPARRPPFSARALAAASRRTRPPSRLARAQPGRARRPPALLSAPRARSRHHRGDARPPAGSRASRSPPRTPLPQTPPRAARRRPAAAG